MYSRYEEGTFTSSDRTALFYRGYIPEENPGRSVIIHHGFGEHSGRYETFILQLVEAGYCCFTFDARGHGKSPGKRGDATGMAQFVSDLECFVRFVKEFNNRRLETIEPGPFLFGHSMGGLISALFALHGLNQWEISALALSGTAFSVSTGPLMQIKKAAGHFLSVMAPEMTMDSGLSEKYLCHDPAVVAAYKNDPLVHGKTSVRMGLDLLTSGKEALQKAERLRIPLWVGHGADDKITSPDGSLTFYQNASSPVKSLQIYPGMYHEILNEFMKDRPIQDILDFLNRL